LSNFYPVLAQVLQVLQTHQEFRVFQAHQVLQTLLVVPVLPAPVQEAPLVEAAPVFYCSQSTLKLQDTL
jgi:hypothetical protein